MTALAEAPPAVPLPHRVPRPRRYLMCAPEHFAVRYAINPWMRPGAPVDRARALRQWAALRQAYLDLGHQVALVEPEPDLPDMVFAANGGLVIGGRALGARFAHPERAAEGPAYLRWLGSPAASAAGVREAVPARAVNEGEGDFLVAGPRILAGTGFRTSRAAHDEVARTFGLPVVSLRLVDPRFYHLDTALAVLADDLVAYLPAAFHPAARRTLRRLYPDAVLASPADADCLGLNAVSDGRHVVLARQAVALGVALRERGFDTVPVDLSELLKAGGGAKCCTLELRGELRR